MAILLGSLAAGGVSQLMRMDEEAKKYADDVVKESLTSMLDKYERDVELRDKEVKETEELIESMLPYMRSAGYTGEIAIAKAASIAKMGKKNAQEMVGYLRKASEEGKIDQLLRYHEIDPDKQGPKSALEAARSIVKEVKAPDPSFGDKLSALGGEGSGGFFSRHMKRDIGKQFRGALADRMATGQFRSDQPSPKFDFPDVEVDLSSIKQFDLTQELENAVGQRQRLIQGGKKESDPEVLELDKKIADIQSARKSMSSKPDVSPATMYSTFVKSVDKLKRLHPVNDNSYFGKMLTFEEFEKRREEEIQKQYDQLAGMADDPTYGPYLSEISKVDPMLADAIERRKQPEVKTKAPTQEELIEAGRRKTREAFPNPADFVADLVAKGKAISDPKTLVAIYPDLTVEQAVEIIQRVQSTASGDTTSPARKRGGGAGISSPSAPSQVTPTQPDAGKRRGGGAN